ncbi:MAG: GNAT family N-acetyltransferase [Deltaproteobacteria bacterium HGW-Deltaproteobacteria-14]|jgi:ribosomal protein S18 acetylase RimI-like enzyme|nr:MAG: GNAT family N-acetyltransferase [Deltaproteobacteria bacterium HGW-Deltaproteobacteria-14]
MPAPPPLSPARVRRAAARDLPAVTALDARAYASEGYGPFVVRQLWDLSPETFLVAEGDAGLLGYCAAARATDGSGWILSLATDPGARGQGVGRALTVAAIAALRAFAPRDVRLTVAPGNVAARRLYASLGFVAAGLEPDYYGPGADRLVMVRAQP